jgi:putative phosphoribosyl transferase
VSRGRGKTALVEEVMTMFSDRVDAGRHLAPVVRAAGLGGDGTVVLGLPRGGVPVAAEVGVALGAPLDVIVVRKLGVPFQPELAMGAIGEDGIRVENEEALGSSAVSAVEFEAIEQRERGELDRRASRYREGRPRLDLEGRCAVIVDDGIATGSTARAACHVAHAHGASLIVLAVPVAPAATVSALQDACDAMLCVAHPDPFFAVGEWYRDFTPTSDEEVNELLRRAQL